MIGKPRLAGNIPSRSVRYVPSAELNTARSENQQALRRLFTPDENPMSVLADAITERSPIKPNLIQEANETYSEEQRAGLWDKLKPLMSTTVGSPAMVQEVLQRVNSLDPVYSGAKPIQVYLQDGKGTGQGGVAYVDHRDEMQPIAKVYADNPYNQAGILAHEAGHILARHADRMPGRRNIDFAQKELEAQAISYGAMNRLYPWNKDFRNASADYGVRVQLIDPEVEGGYSEGAVNPVQYLRNAENNAYLNNLIQKIVPEPRQPFRNILPAIYQ